MTAFWMLAALMAALALAIVLPPLLRHRAAAAPPEARGSNLAVLREQRAQLEAERASGGIDDAAYQLALTEIERRVLDEETPGARAAPSAHGPARKTALALGLGLPLLVFALYTQLGQPDAFGVAQELAAAQQADAAASAAEIEALVDGLAQRMEREPERADGWALLGRAYAAMQRFPEASRAFARAVALTPGDAQLLADYADALAVTQGGKAAGEPTRLIEQALAIEPGNLKALAMAGSAAFERGDLTAAAGHWRRALELAPPESPFAAAMERSLHDVQQARGAAGPDVAAAPASAPPAAAAPAAAAASGARLAGRLSVAPALAARVAPTDTVFVFARAVDGPRMPLAIQRYPASALPLAFTLDDSTAMSPELRLSNFARVIVGARISKSGEALPQAGDLQTQTEVLAPGRADLELVIDRVQP